MLLKYLDSSVEAFKSVNINATCPRINSLPFYTRSFVRHYMMYSCRSRAAVKRDVHL